MPTGKDSKTTQNEIIELTESNGTQVKTEDTANYINKYFTGVGAKKIF